jgi:multidrug efflux system outer membrane protein
MKPTFNPLHAAPLLAALLLSACAAPEFRQPKIDTPQAFKEARTNTTVQVAPDGSRWQQAQPAEQQPRGEWWLAFNDPALNQLIAEATQANANLAAAAARVKQARAIAGVAEADRSPQVGIGVGAQRGFNGPDSPGQSGAGGQTSYQARLTASYEVDRSAASRPTSKRPAMTQPLCKPATAPCCWSCRPTWRRLIFSCAPPSRNWTR